MLHRFLFCLALAAGFSLPAAERTFDFSKTPEGELPAGFHSTVTGEGRPGEWRVIRQTLSSPYAPSNTVSSVTVQETALAQLATDRTDEHFPLLVFEDETFDDFTLTTHFKTVSGEVEQMAGIAFRIQDETNYYVLRASSLGNSVRFYKFVNGIRSQPVGVDVPVPVGTWHELGVECRGNRIRCSLDGQLIFPELIDPSFARGKFGLWTKSDSVTYFQDTRIVYTPKINLARQLVTQTMKEYSRLRGVQIFTTNSTQPELHIVASSNEKEIGTPAGKVEKDVMAREIPYWGKEEDRTSVVVPLRDRNGEAAAVVRFYMDSRTGQTEANALARVMPIIKGMQKQVSTAADLAQ